MPPLDTDASTSRSLLARAQDHDDQSWERLSALYAPVVYRWARQRNLQAADAADVVQLVLLQVLQSISTFERRRTGSFRAWLWTITYHAIIHQQREEGGSPQAGGGTAFLERLHEIPDPSASTPAPPGAETLRIARRALGLLETDFEPHVWQAFWRSTIDRQTAAEVAEELGMSRAAVYQSKSRVLRRLRTELDGLLD